MSWKIFLIDISLYEIDFEIGGSIFFKLNLLWDLMMEPTFLITKLNFRVELTIQLRELTKFQPKFILDNNS